MKANRELEARILLWDCETAPLISANWGIWEQNAVWVVKDFYMLCFSYKWLGEKKVNVIGLDDFKSHKAGSEDDSKLILELHKLFSEANVIIAHNGDQFDQKIANARFMVHKLGPPSPYKQIDTKKVAKRYARFTSNKLDDLGKTLGLGQKLSTGGAALWQGCMLGDSNSWKKMKCYNKQDVVLLEQLYLELRPWITNHPGMNLMLDETGACPKCGLGPLHKRGFNFKKSTVYQRLQCQNCGGWSESRVKEEHTRKVAYVN